MLGALAAYAASQAVLQGEIARQYPNLTLGPGYQLDQGKEKWSVGIGVTLPVFNRNEGPIAAAEASRAAAAANFLAVQNRVLAEVDRAVADYASVQADMEMVRGLRTTLERQTRLMRSRHEAGRFRGLNSCAPRWSSSTSPARSSRPGDVRRTRWEPSKMRCSARWRGPSWRGVGRCA